MTSILRLVVLVALLAGTLFCLYIVVHSILDMMDSLEQAPASPCPMAGLVIGWVIFAKVAADYVMSKK